MIDGVEIDLEDDWKLLFPEIKNDLEDKTSLDQNNISNGMFEQFLNTNAFALTAISSPISEPTLTNTTTITTPAIPSTSCTSSAPSTSLPSQDDKQVSQKRRSDLVENQQEPSEKRRKKSDETFTGLKKSKMNLAIPMVPEQCVALINELYEQKKKLLSERKHAADAAQRKAISSKIARIEKKISIIEKEQKIIALNAEKATAQQLNVALLRERNQQQQDQALFQNITFPLMSHEYRTTLVLYQNMIYNHQEINNKLIAENGTLKQQIQSFAPVLAENEKLKQQIQSFASVLAENEKLKQQVQLMSRVRVENDELNKQICFLRTMLTELQSPLSSQERQLQAAEKDQSISITPQSVPSLIPWYHQKKTRVPLSTRAVLPPFNLPEGVDPPGNHSKPNLKK